MKLLFKFMPKFNKEGDGGKLDRLYQYYERAMYNIAYSILHDKYLGEDVVNETIIKIIKYLPQISDIECHKTKALIVIIVKNTAIDVYRKRKKQFQQEIELEELDEVTGNEELILDQIIADEDYHELLASLKGLKKEYQEIILLKYVYDLSNREISHLMNITEDLVRQHICRARKAVKKLMEKKEN